MNSDASYWATLCDIVTPQRFQYWARIGWRDGNALAVSAWDQMLAMPNEKYLESSEGPVPLRLVEWVDVSTRVVRRGISGGPRLMKDVKEELLAKLLGTQLIWEERDGTWSVTGIFDDEPVDVIRVLGPRRLSLVRS